MKLLIASSNPAKLREYRLLLKGFELKPCGVEIAENGKTFKQNAILKVRACAKASGLPAIADDSGLEIKALNGFPGIRSARFAKGDFKQAMVRILAKLKDQRRARFVCVIALYLPQSGKVKTFTGTVAGLIAPRPRGRGGFGYDPIFYLPRLKKTFGQMSAREKAQSSHRSRAAKKLIAFLKKSM